jgi:hypothetical protein
VVGTSPYTVQLLCAVQCSSPRPGLVDLRAANVKDLPAASIVDCRYGVQLWIQHRTIIGVLDPPYNLLALVFRAP